jgi:hypothetical protein
MAPAIPHQISLKKTDVGTEKEHWALHVHPVEPGKSDLHILHAVSVPGNEGVLEPWDQNAGTYESRPAKEKSETVPLGTFTTKGKALAAVTDAEKNVHLTEQYPTQNCVDFACAAVKHMVKNKHLPPEAEETMTAHYNKDQATVRKNTNTADAKKAAGVVR